MVKPLAYLHLDNRFQKYNKILILSIGLGEFIYKFPKTYYQKPFWSW